MGWTTLSVREETAERFNDTKEAIGEPAVPELTADLFLNSLLDTLEAANDGKYGDPLHESGKPTPVDFAESPEDLRTDALMCSDIDPDKLMDKLNTIEAAAKEATKAAQDTQTTVEGLQQ